MEIQGLTPIDTLYEFMGYTISLRLGQYLLWNGYILGFLLSTALVRLYYVGAREGTYKDLAVYPLYVLFMLFLVWPIDVALTAPRSQSSDFLEETSAENGNFWDPSEGTGGGVVRPDTLKVPRILAYVSALVSSFQKNLVSDICDDMHGAMYQWKHVAAINASARIFDRPLREDLGVYLKCCYYPALTTDRNRDPDPWKIVPFAGLPFDSWLLGIYKQMDLRSEETRLGGDSGAPCWELHQSLSDAVSMEIDGATFHHKALAAYTRLANQKGGGQGSAAEYAKFYRRRLIYNEIFVIGGSTAATLRAALPEYSLFKDGNLDLKYITTDSQDKGTLMNVLTAVTKVPAALAAVASSVSEGWSQKAMGPATYYRVSALGPYVYGLLLAILVIVFPIAGLLAIWPQWWTAIVNFMKLFLSIKLWPIFWAFLSGMMSYKEAFTPEDPEGFQGTFGSEGMLPALAVMYLIVPVFSFMITSIAQHAGGAMLGSLIGQGQAASLGGTMGAITQPSSMAGRIADSQNEGRRSGGQT